MSKKATIVFDIDGVLVVQPSYASVYSDARDFFMKVGYVIDAYGFEHYVPPGIIELFKLVFSFPEVDLVFFSAGTSERNNELIKRLLIIALGRQKYESVRSNVKIFSREHCSIGFFTEGNKTCEVYQKNLEKIAGREALDNIIFFDDNEKSIYPGQNKHCILVPKCMIDFFVPEVGSVEEMFKHVNQAYYLAGILGDFIMHRDDAVIADRLAVYRDCNDRTQYEKGLGLLRTFNPKLSFITREFFSFHVQVKSVMRQTENSRNSHEPFSQELIRLPKQANAAVAVSLASNTQTVFASQDMNRKAPQAEIPENEAKKVNCCIVS